MILSIDTCFQFTILKSSGVFGLKNGVFTFLYSFYEFEYRKKDQFSHLCLFGDVFWLQNTPLSSLAIVPYFRKKHL